MAKHLARCGITQFQTLNSPLEKERSAHCNPSVTSKNIVMAEIVSTEKLEDELRLAKLGYKQEVSGRCQTGECRPDFGSRPYRFLASGSKLKETNKLTEMLSSFSLNGA